MSGEARAGALSLRGIQHKIEHLDHHTKHVMLESPLVVHSCSEVVYHSGRSIDLWLSERSDKVILTNQNMQQFLADLEGYDDLNFNSQLLLFQRPMSSLFACFDGNVGSACSHKDNALFTQYTLGLFKFYLSV